ncbi:hypothetical protein PGIGA_G00013430 [Pangasianodon gigas]|uniref:Uncharacterized protein n=1 Tax=Pangasianodon gigas TaxID=30993 RepID=A0ACC5WT95_PANGG|nr:hypothetical protein [Pangasianodon gigas]
MMSPVIQLGFLLLCFVVAESCDVSYEPRLKNERENELLSRNDSSPHERDDVNKKGKIRCLVCRKLIKRTMPSVSRKLKKKLDSACHIFINFHQHSCMKKAAEIHKAMMEFWFPKKNPLLACRKLNMCKKKQIHPRVLM